MHKYITRQFTITDGHEAGWFANTLYRVLSLLTKKVERLQRL